MRSVSISGLGPETRVRPPFGQPGWENWGLALDAEWLPLFDRVFEIHDPAMWRVKGAYVPPSWESDLRAIPMLYMREAYPDFPSATRYPREAVAAVVGCRLSCSVAFMLGLAIFENARRIYLTGCDLTREEHRRQRENIVHLLGVAKGRGVWVTGPSAERLLEFPDYGTEVL